MTQITDGTPTLPTAQASSNLKVHDQSLAKGVAWTAGAKWSSQFLSWASLIIVARLLSPADPQANATDAPATRNERMR